MGLLRRQPAGGSRGSGGSGNAPATDGINFYPFDPWVDRVSNGIAVTALTTYIGGLYKAATQLEFNRLVFNCQTFTSNIAAVVALYQSADGTSVPPFALNSTWGVTVTAAGSFSALRIDGGGNAVILPGMFFGLWGRNGAGTAAITCVNTPTVQGLTLAPIPAGSFPISFSTAIAVTAAPPASIDPTTFTDAANRIIELRSRRL